jgi:hypothetical protein
MSPQPSRKKARSAPGISSSLSDWPRPTTPQRSYCCEAIEPDRHPLILDGLAVTFYLVFKEPTYSLTARLSRRPSEGEPFKLTNPRTACQGPISPHPRFFEPLTLTHSAGQRTGPTFLPSEPAQLSGASTSRAVTISTTRGAFPSSGRRVASPCPLPRQRARRILELEGRDARRLLSTWNAVRLPLRARHLAASLTNIRPCVGRVNRVFCSARKNPV